jgi:hypothetical protein
MPAGDVHGLRLFWIGACLWIVCAFAGGWCLKTFNVEGLGVYATSLVMLAPAGLMLVGLIRMIRLQDELYQRIQFEAIAFAAILVWLGTLTWGFLETLALVRPLPGFGIASALVLFYGFGGWLFGKRYQ